VSCFLDMVQIYFLECCLLVFLFYKVLIHLKNLKIKNVLILIIKFKIFVVLAKQGLELKLELLYPV
jgi:hypothetical protein